MVLALLSYVAEGDWEECYIRWKEGALTARKAMTLTGLKKDSFYRLVKKYESLPENSSNEE